MDFDPIVLSIPIYFILIGLELIVQQISHKGLYRFNDAVTNISCGITQQVSGVFMKIFMVGIYHVVYTHISIFQIPVTWYTLVVLFIAQDFCYYWAHRKSHEINLFWAGHVVHHQSEDYNLSVALRQGSFQVIFTFVFSLPLAIIGFDTASFIFISALVTLYQFWIHTETIGKLGPIEWIFNTPSHHRVHHGRDPKYIDKNHAGVFIIWDKMFGTFQEEQEKPTYGITKPINSWNPVWANFNHFVEMGHMLKQIPDWKDKFKLLYKKPGWRPDDMGGYMPIPEIDKETYRKYTNYLPLSINLYVLFQYTLILVGTAVLLFQHEQLPLGTKIISVTLVVWGVLNCGAMFESRTWAYFMEFARIPFTLSYLLFMFDQHEAFSILLGTGSVLVAISIIWLLFFFKFFTKKAENANFQANDNFAENLNKTTV